MFAVDVQDWFASTNVERAISSLQSHVADGAFLQLIRDALRVANRDGLPPGNALSQVVAEWYIDTKKALPASWTIYRWYDSFGGGAESSASAQERVAAIAASLEPLGLRLNPRKTLVMRSADLLASLKRFGYSMD